MSSSKRGGQHSHSGADGPTLIWNERHLRRALRQFELHHNAHRSHQAMNQAAPVRAIPEPITDLGRISRLDIRRRDRLAGVIPEYRDAA